MKLSAPTIRISGNSLLAFLIVAIIAGLLLLFMLRSESVKLYPYSVETFKEFDNHIRHFYFQDMDFDGKSERMVITHYSDVNVLEIFNEEGAFVDVIKVQGSWLDNQPTFICDDTDGDGSSELYIFSVSHDSILLNGYEFFGDGGHFLVNHYIDKYKDDEKTNNIRLVDVKFVDFKMDGTTEILFILRAGYSLYPRKIYRVNPWTREMKSTTESLASYQWMHVSADTAGVPEKIVTGTAAFENYKGTDSVLFRDDVGRIIIYSPDLSRVLMVKEYTENKSYVTPFLKHCIDGDFIFSFIVEMKENVNYLEKIKLDGETVLKKKILNGNLNCRLMNPILPNLEQIVLMGGDSLYFFDDQLNLQRVEVGVGKELFTYQAQSIRNMKDVGFLPYLSDNQLVFRDRNMHKIAVYTPESVLNRRYQVSIVNQDPPDNYTIALTNESENHYFKLKRNPLYAYRLIFYMIIYSVLFGLIYLLFRVQVFLLTRRYVNKARITELQLQTVQNQLQPHFTFNVLNSIGSMIYKDQKEKAYEYLNYFSDMLRSTLLSRTRPDWQIGEELGFIGTYMAMENLRFDNRFEYVLEIRQGTDMAKLVPKLAIQSFVENAVRHGLMHKEGMGRLSISVGQTKEHLQVDVKDNGIGRLASRNLQRQQNGFGNKILMEYMEIYNRNNKVKFIFEIEDLHDKDGSAAGTKVTINIPLDFGSNSTL